MRLRRARALYVALAISAGGIDLGDDLDVFRLGEMMRAHGLHAETDTETDICVGILRAAHRQHLGQADPPLDWLHWLACYGYNPSRPVHLIPPRARRQAQLDSGESPE